MTCPPTVTLPVDRVSVGWKNSLVGRLPSAVCFPASVFGGCEAFRLAGGAAAIMAIAAAESRIRDFITEVLQPPVRETSGRRPSHRPLADEDRPFAGTTLGKFQAKLFVSCCDTARLRIQQAGK